jgi:ankyrin repeat protein
MEGHVCIMELLHKAGAGVSNVNNRGRTPLMESGFVGREKAVKFLLEKVADPRMRDHKGRTALDLAQDSVANKREREGRASMYRNSSDLRSARI